MFTVVLIIQIMITVAMVVVVLLQRSEGGALGIGGGGGGGLGGLMTGRGAANLLTRTTAILAACFFATSIILTIIARNQAEEGIEFDSAIIEGTEIPDEDAISVQDMLDTTGQPSIETEASGPATVEDDEVPTPAATEPAEEGPAIPDEDE